jgi:hypothetical protein
MIESLKQSGHQRKIHPPLAAQSKPGLQWSGESGITEIVLLGRLSLSRILPRRRAQNRAFLLPAQPQLTKDNLVILAWDKRIGRLRGSNPVMSENSIALKTRVQWGRVRGTLCRRKETIFRYVTLCYALEEDRSS